MAPVGVCVHNTANDAPAKNEIAYMVGNNLQTSFHFAVDDAEVWQGLPLNRNGWHAGDGNGEGNRKHIGIEICYSKSGGDKFTKAEERACQFIAQLLKERNWGVDKVKKHQDFSGKYCPSRTLDLGWQRFINRVETIMGGNMANMYKGYDLANPESMKVAVDILVRVQAGEFVNKSELNAEIQAHKQTALKLSELKTDYRGLAEQLEQKTTELEQAKKDRERYKEERNKARKELEDMAIELTECQLDRAELAKKLESANSGGSEIKIDTEVKVAGLDWIINGVQVNSEGVVTANYTKK